MYRYQDFTEWLATPEGIAATGEVLKKVETVLRPAGAAVISKLWPQNAPSNWHMMAAVDRVAELGIIVEVEQVRTPMGQHRIFRRTALSS